MMQDVSEHPDRGMIAILFVAIAIFAIQGIRQFGQPQEVVIGTIHPLDTGVLAVSRPVRRFETTLIQNRAKNLYAFEDHLVDVTVTVVLRTEWDVNVEYENVHELFRNKGNPEQASVAQLLT